MPVLTARGVGADALAGPRGLPALGDWCAALMAAPPALPMAVTIAAVAHGGMSTCPANHAPAALATPAWRDTPVRREHGGWQRCRLSRERLEAAVAGSGLRADERRLLDAVALPR